MKKLTKIAIILVLFTFLVSISQNALAHDLINNIIYPRESCISYRLNLIVLDLQTKTPISNAKIYMDDKLIGKTNQYGKFFYIIEDNKLHKIRIEKEGYLPKTISIYPMGMASCYFKKIVYLERIQEQPQPRPPSPINPLYPCEPSNPLVLIFPSIKEGYPSDTITYKLKIVNKNSFFCQPSKIKLWVKCKSGFICYTNKKGTILAPLSSFTTTLYVKILTKTPGIYPIEIYAKDLTYNKETKILGFVKVLKKKKPKPKPKPKIFEIEILSLDVPSEVCINNETEAKAKVKLISNRPSLLFVNWMLDDNLISQTLNFFQINQTKEFSINFVVKEEGNHTIKIIVGKYFPYDYNPIKKIKVKSFYAINCTKEMEENKTEEEITKPKVSYHRHVYHRHVVVSENVSKEEKRIEINFLPIQIPEKIKYGKKLNFSVKINLTESPQYPTYLTVFVYVDEKMDSFYPISFLKEGLKEVKVSIDTSKYSAGNHSLFVYLIVNGISKNQTKLFEIVGAHCIEILDIQKIGNYLYFKVRNCGNYDEENISVKEMNNKLEIAKNITLKRNSEKVFGIDLNEIKTKKLKLKVENDYAKVCKEISLEKAIFISEIFFKIVIILLIASLLAYGIYRYQQIQIRKIPEEFPKEI
ncbi:MAG: hypothetical protein B6U78_01295 [Candidatus Aenigmarchaeota archaeon ex4484_224]|nr:MAG: hypothetical protein B6U78_01295 [Candidatus Aenigmarchaeota archaeon ex4484_224]